MTDNDIDPIGVSRRRVLGGLGTIGVDSAGVGLGTTAFFSDSESFGNNALTAGKLDLYVYLDYGSSRRKTRASARGGCQRRVGSADRPGPVPPAAAAISRPTDRHRVLGAVPGSRAVGRPVPRGPMVPFEPETAAIATAYLYPDTAKGRMK